MALGSSGEGTAAIPGWRVRWRAYGGMQIQRNDTAGLSKRRSGRSCGRNRRGRSNDLRTTTDAVRSRSRARSSALFGNRELRCGRDHGALSDVQITDWTSRCGLDARRRRDDRRLQSLISSCVRSPQIRRRSYHRIVQRRRISAIPDIGLVSGRRYDGVLYLRCDSRNLGGRGQGNGRDREPRLFSLVGPRHDVRQGHVALQLDVRRRDDGLRSVVGLRRQRDDRLAREFRVRFLRLLRLLRAGIEGWKIFRRLVVDHLRVVESWHCHALGLQRKEASQSDQQRERNGVIDDRLKKSSPGKRARHEHIRPERRWSGTQFERRKPARKDEIAEVAEEHARP